MIFVDVETFKDYFLIQFMTEDGKRKSYEMYEGQKLDTAGVADLMKRYTTVGFNSAHYDLWMIAAALEGRGCARLKTLSDDIILTKLPGWKVAQNHGVDTMWIKAYGRDYKPVRGSVSKQWDHIDLIDVAPGKAGLKIYGARLGAKNLRDLPFDPNDEISEEDRAVVRDYCGIDLDVTKLLYDTLKPQIDLRVQMGQEYKLDLRSQSDAQIAEQVLASEIMKATGKKPKVPKVAEGKTYRYQDPKIIAFETPQLQDIFKKILAHEFDLAPNGSIKLPDWLRETKIGLGSGEYQMGIGGLHSCEKEISMYPGDNQILVDYDVASYYPSIILQQGIAPSHLGDGFTDVYRRIVERRLAAKASGDKVTADTLKIVVNGSFGKLGSKYSILYSPDLMIQTTLTGQLALLMLIERLEAFGAQVVSANTDGVTVLYDADLDVDQVIWDWELDTSYELEATRYRSLHKRDVNNYIAVKPDGSTKRKGAFAKPWLMKNPQFPVVSEAIAQHLSEQADYRDVIRQCKDIRQFVMVRQVTGGAVWRDEHLGKAVRFYYSTEVGQDECIHYAKNSNKVPQSDGCRPCMDIPDTIPDDVEIERYVGMAQIAMKGMGVTL